MIMRKIFAIAAALAFLPALAMAAPNFTGTWVRDSANSDTVPGSMYWLTRGVDAGGARGPQSQVTLDITQTASSLTLVDPVEKQRTFTLDGKPYSVPTDTGVETATVTSTLNDANLTIVTQQPWGGMPGNVGLTVRRTWTLSPDGRVLTVNTVRDTPAKRETYREVFNKR
jgi:hypothetical protein